MPITITPVSPTGVVGPGLPLQLSSSFIGPLSENAVVLITISTDLEGVNVLWQQAFKMEVPQLIVYPVTDAGGSLVIGNMMVNDGADVRVIAELEDPAGTPIDSGAITAPLNTQQGLANVVHLKDVQPTALTPDQALQLSQVHATVFPVASMDGMGLSILTAPGGVASFDGPLPGPVMGILLRLDQVPDQLVPISGDPDYWRQTLAQASIFRSNDLWLRFPLHTSSRIFNLPGSETAAGVAAVLGASWLLNMHLTVTTFPGVLVTVGILTLP